MDCTVIGGGSFGITLALLLHRQGHRIGLWEFDPAACRALLEEREDKRKLPGVRLPDDILVTNHIRDVLGDKALFVFAVPTQFIRSVLKDLKKADFSRSVVVNVAKGIETGTLKRVSQIFEEENPTVSARNYVVLSGPSHAEEVSRNIPTTVVAASSEPGNALKVQQTLSGPYFRIYTNEDVAGVELAGSVKNVIALAAGILDGLGFGDNTKGALLTRGLAEMTRLGIALGARQETFFGLSGIGDLVTTCFSRHSRNRHVGEAVGRGKKLEEVLKTMTMVAEGVETTRSVHTLAKKHGIEMPITEKVHAVLFEGCAPQDAIRSLMERELKPEVL
jgi:glycerol-3-phosphate dehydrogenase (NAD(P)+)